MKATLEFNLPEDGSEFEYATKGSAMFLILWNVKQEYRKLMKYHDLTENEYKIVEALNDSLHEDLQHEGINLDK
jgi:hypothetical protein